VGRVWFFDIQGWITLFIGGLLELITFFSSYSYVHVPFSGNDALNQGLLKKPNRLQRSLFQRLKPDKLASIRAIDDCYNC
jgi:hypothetical protein